MKNLNETIPEFILASLLSGYPDESYRESINNVLENPVFQNSKFDSLKNVLAPYFESEISVEDLRSEYIDLFDRGRAENSMYETEYGRDRTIVKTSELADLAGFYKAFGFEFGSEGYSREMIDHISMELEFYALLMMKEAYQIEQENEEAVQTIHYARGKLMLDHLGRFAKAITTRPGVLTSEYYSIVMGFCAELIEYECAELGIQPTLTTWSSNTRGDDEVSCGGSLVPHGP